MANLPRMGSARCSKKFAVITCDVVNSRQHTQEKLLEVIHRCLEDTNRKFASALMRDFRIVLGDMIQGVCARKRRAYDIYQWLEELLHLEGEFHLGRPVLIRCGIGIGRIDNPKAPIEEMSGESFSYAAESLEILKREKRSSCVAVRWKDKDFSEFVSSALGVAQALKNRWDTQTRKIVLLARERNTQTQIANRLKLSRIQVKTALEMADFKKLRQFEKNIAKILGGI